MTHPQTAQHGAGLPERLEANAENELNKVTLNYEHDIYTNNQERLLRIIVEADNPDEAKRVATEVVDRYNAHATLVEALRRIANDKLGPLSNESDEADAYEAMQEVAQQALAALEAGK